MNPKSFNEALKATARIACCAGLVGLVACQAKVEESASEPDTAHADSQHEDVYPVNVSRFPNYYSSQKIRII